MKSHTFSIQNSHQSTLLLVTSSSYSLHFLADRNHSTFFLGTKIPANKSQSTFSPEHRKNRNRQSDPFPFSCSGLLFHFLILWIADARNGRRLALHTSRQEHWDVIGCLRPFTSSRTAHAGQGRESPAYLLRSVRNRRYHSFPQYDPDQRNREWQ